MNNLEKRIEYLESLEEIRYLKHYYFCLCVDRAVAGDANAINETLSRFTDDIEMYFTGFPLFVGKQEVAGFFTETVPDVLQWSHHRVMNEVITIDGGRASAIWYFDCPAVYRDFVPDHAGNSILAGRYEERYVRQNGQWMFKEINALVEVRNKVESSWDGAKRVLRSE